MSRHRWAEFLVLCAGLFAHRLASADEFDPPATYYNSATGTGATLKQQLNDIIDGHTTFSYNSARSILQITDADPNNPGHILLVYNRVSLNVAAIDPDGPIPGWDGGSSWNREHVWPISRGLNSEAIPDGSDLFNLRPSNPSINTSRNNLNFGGAYDAQSYGSVADGGTKWYPGNSDAGMVARQGFYMSTRYDGADSGTSDLQLATGSPGTGSMLGDLNRLIEYHFAAPPDMFERRRNQIIFDDYQHNRNPYIDHPEYAWSVFVDQSNDSQITIAGGTVDGNGGSTFNLDLGRVYVGGAVPSAQILTINKGGNNGTYFEVALSGAATSSLSGRYNAFRTGMTDSKSIEVGLTTDTSTSGTKSGAVMISNLDITTGGGAGHGANDADDVIDVSLAVLDHPIASFDFNEESRTKVIDFGIIPLQIGSVLSDASITNLEANGAPQFAANLDLDSIQGTGETGAFALNLSTFTNLAQGNFVDFMPEFTPAGIGQVAAEYTLFLSDEDLPGELTQTLSMMLLGEAILQGDYNRDGTVDAADYITWRHTLHDNVTAYFGADGNGDTLVDESDYQVWRDHFGDVVAGSGTGSQSSSSAPEPGGILLVASGYVVFGLFFGVPRRHLR